MQTYTVCINLIFISPGGWIGMNRCHCVLLVAAGQHM